MICSFPFQKHISNCFPTYASAIYFYCCLALLMAGIFRFCSFSKKALLKLKLGVRNLKQTEGNFSNRQSIKTTFVSSIQANLFASVCCVVRDFSAFGGELLGVLDALNNFLIQNGSSCCCRFIGRYHVLRSS